MKPIQYWVTLTFVNIVDPLPKSFGRDIGRVPLEYVSLFLRVVDVDIDVDGVGLLGQLAHYILALVVVLHLPPHRGQLTVHFPVHSKSDFSTKHNYSTN